MDVEKEDRLFDLLDEAAYTSDYTEPFRYMQDEKIDPVEGILGYIEQGLEVATTALESKTGDPEKIPIIDIEKKGGLVRLKRVEKVADDMAEKKLVKDQELQELRQEIWDIQESYDYLINI